MLATKNLSLEKNSLQKMAMSLSNLLADTYLLYTKTQNFHWNIIDERFYSLHKMLEEHYEELAEANDTIAERIRMLGHSAPGSMREFLEMSTLEESTANMSGSEMLMHLLHDHEKMIHYLRQKIEEADALNDQGTQDMLIQRLRAHEKMAWMLRSHFPAN